MVLVQAKELSFRYDSRVDALFSGASFSLYSGDKVALLGHNGVGKTTLLNVLLGELQAEGELVCSHSIGVLRQEDKLEYSGSVLDALLSQHAELFVLHGEMQRAEAAGLPDPLRYADVVAGFTELGGFDLLNQLETELSQLSFSEAVLSQEASSLSGGERRLLKLMSVFLQERDVLVLDEPTNYLDEAATQFLIEKIKAFSGACLVVSHDRWFLDQTVTKVLELEHQLITEYKGNYSVFRETKDGIFRQKVRKKEKLETEISKLQTIERSYKVWGARKEKEKTAHADKGFIGARAAKLRKRGIQAKERMTNRIEDLKEAKPWIDKRYAVSFEDVKVPSGTCVVLRDLRFAYGRKAVLEDVSLTIEWAERLAIVGENGSGKSTLIKLLLGELSPRSGEVLWSKGCTVGYLPQLWVNPAGLTKPAELFSELELPQARLMLGALRVKGDLIYQPFEALSEGQKRKVRLVRLMLDKPNVLILDEPTTHLDYESVEMLEDALLEYQGTLLLVSHDKYLRERVCEAVLAIEK